MFNKKNNTKLKYARIASEIKKELQILFSTEIQDKRIKSQVVISDCIVTKDLSLCKVYIYSEQIDKMQLLKVLDNAKGFFRMNIAKTLDLRKTPDFKFYLDEIIDNMNHIEALLKKVNNTM